MKGENREPRRGHHEVVGPRRPFSIHSLAIEGNAVGYRVGDTPFHGLLTARVPEPCCIAESAATNAGDAFCSVMTSLRPFGSCGRTMQITSAWVARLEISSSVACSAGVNPMGGAVLVATLFGAGPSDAGS